ncbi:DUF4258 domain-containing protein [bacterium]|nr:MAG: DUF4258 domain-containing protein [bacterium]
MSPTPITDFVITDHAASELGWRGVSEEIVRQVLTSPEQGEQIRPGRVVLQSRITMGLQGKEYLIRVFVDVDRKSAEVVTAYRTTKISKYWRVEA